MTFDPQIPPKPIEILAFPNVQLLDVAGPLQVFASANELVRATGRPLPYDARVVAAAEMITASAGLGLLAHPLPAEDAPVDTLLIAGGAGIDAAAADPTLVQWVRARAAKARRVASVCTGAFMLGAAGLLDGRRAVTHWAHCAELIDRFPAIRVEPDPIFIRDGDVWTSAGVTAGIDLSLALVEADLGRKIALAVARHLVVFLKRPGGQAQFSTALSLQEEGQPEDDKFARLHDWIIDHLASDLSVPMLAERVGMSERSFIRHYSAATGISPGRAVERLRVEAARHRLADTRLPIKHIAGACGFGSEETMRRSFLRQIATTPQAFRERFAPATLDPHRPGS